MRTIGFAVDKIEYKPDLFCRIGLHSARKYLFYQEDGISYFVCKRCGKLYRVWSNQI